MVKRVSHSGFVAMMMFLNEIYYSASVFEVAVITDGHESHSAMDLHDNLAVLLYNDEIYCSLTHPWIEI